MSARQVIKNPTPAQVTLAEVGHLARELQARELETARARERLAVRIRAAVEQRVVSQSDLARVAGISRQRISQLVHDE